MKLLLTTLEKIYLDVMSFCKKRGKLLTKKILNNYNDKYSANENLFNNGYRIIYDCGNYKYILNINKKVK